VNTAPFRGLLEVLQQVPDSRGRSGRRHPLSAMLAAVVCATLCGHRGIRATVRWLNLHGIKMAHLLGFTRNPPCRKTYSDILAEVNPAIVEQVLLEFIDQLNLPEVAETLPVQDDDVEVWDGKTLRGTRTQDSRAERLLVRMAHSLQRVISSTAIPRETNEHATAFDLVKSLVVREKLIVADAAYCQRDFCQEVVDQGGDYLVTVKANQPQLLRDIEQAFVIPEGFSPLRGQARTSPATNFYNHREKPRSSGNSYSHDHHQRH
jgi:hypothetical protein